MKDWVAITGVVLVLLGTLIGLIAAALHSMIAFAIACFVAGGVLLMGSECD